VRDHRRNVRWRTIAAPGHMQVRAHKKKSPLVNPGQRWIVEVMHAQRCSNSLKSFHKGFRTFRIPTKLKEAESWAEPVRDRLPASEPHMR